MNTIPTIVPEHCHLWSKIPLVPDDFLALKEVERYRDDGDLIRQLMKCDDCGQHYYKEFYEIADWTDGNDAQYRTYIPIKPTASIIKKMNELTILTIHNVEPRLLDNWQTDGTRTIGWVGKTNK